MRQISLRDKGWEVVKSHSLPCPEETRKIEEWYQTKFITLD